jgi:hypothetical protein
MEFQLSFPDTGPAEITLLADQGEVLFLVSRNSDPFQEVFNTLLNLRWKKVTHYLRIRICIYGRAKHGAMSGNLKRWGRG